MDKADIENRFTFHPADAAKGILHSEIRNTLGTLAQIINVKVPEGREKSLAITHLEEAMFWANAAIARNN